MNPVREVSECFVYQPEIKRLTKANSFTAGGRVIYIVKKDYKGKAIKMYVSYDYETKVQLVAHHDKDEVIRFISKQDLSVLGSSEYSLF